jgi:tetratricopeptide (TPR) repeat protein
LKVREKNRRAPQGHLRRISSTVIVLASLVTAYYSLRIAYAEYLFRSGRPGTIERAAALAPLRADYQARLKRLDQAVMLNPYLASAWIELGLRAEAAGDAAKAEAALRQAATVDHTFEPRWTLANFYFRRANWDEFWKWIRAAADMSYGDRTGVFQLSWRATTDSQMILDRAIPADRSVLASYVAFLAGASRYPAAQAAASRWLPLAVKTDVPALLQFCDLLIEKAHDSMAALQIWNALIEKGWLPFPPLQLNTGSVITNGTFRAPPLSHGFDWRLPSQPGIRVTSQQGLAITLDGHQEEQTDLLIQWLPLRPSSQYEITIYAQSADIPANSGLRLKILDGASATVFAESEMSVPVSVLRFETPLHASLGKLVLCYRRALGTNRIAGTVVLSSIAIVPQLRR